MRVNLVQRILAVLLLSVFVGAGVMAPSFTVAQDATPAAAGLPEGALGEQIQWLVDYINMPAADAASVDLTTKFSPGVLADVPADQLAAIIGRLRDQLAPVSVDPSTIATSRDTPPTNANFTLIGRDGTQQPVSLSVAPDTGLISSIWFSTQLPPVATSTATITVLPTETATAPPAYTATAIPTVTLTPVPTETPTSIPTETATEVPTETPTAVPTETPTEIPTETPTPAPTETATAVPTETPTEAPTETATSVPTKTATKIPTDTPTLVPTETPTALPTETPTSIPTDTPTDIPTKTATEVPTETATEVPTHTPTELPTKTATAVPTETPTSVPTETETLVPTETETETSVPTKTETRTPTETETPVPTETETEVPTETATAVPTETSTDVPTEMATEVVIAAATPIASEEATVEGSPGASPVASPDASPFGDSAIGQQAAWTWSILNNGGEPISESEIEAHIAPDMLALVPAAQVAGGISQIQQLYGPLTLEPDSILITENEPPTNLSYVVTGNDGTQLQVSLSIDPASGLLTGFLIGPVSASGTPVAVAVPAGLTDTEVSFTSGDDTLYGSFLAPDGVTASDALPAALIISGSGPTDRNGNSGGLSMNTNLNLAVTLAQAGIPSLRYDKLGSGQTGLGSHADGTGIDYELFAQEARDAADFLAEQPAVDPSKLIIVGHSEGALFALVLAQELTDAGAPPAALILASPLSVRYLDILHEQLTGTFEAAVAAQAMTDDQAAKLTTELEEIIESLRTTGALPATSISAELATIFSPANADFLAQIDKIDPGDVAASLPADLPVLVLLGNKDAQVTGDQVRHLMEGFRSAGNEVAHFAALPLADHTLRVVEGEADPSVDYANPDLEFSPQAVTEIDDFLTEHGLAQAD